MLWFLDLFCKSCNRYVGVKFQSKFHIHGINCLYLDVVACLLGVMCGVSNSEAEDEMFALEGGRGLNA